MVEAAVGAEIALTGVVLVQTMCGGSLPPFRAPVRFKPSVPQEPLARSPKVQLGT